MGQLAARGHHLTSDPGEAEVIVVNTCSFIDPAKQESVDTILEMADYKKSGRARKLIVAGCLVERYRGEIRKDMPEVDAIVGTNELEKIVAACEGGEASATAYEPYLYHDLTPRRAFHPASFRVHQDRRGLRSSLLLLRDPAVSRQISQPAIRIRGGRSHAPVLPRRTGDQSDRSGHHVIRRGSGPEGRSGAADGAAGAN